MSQGHTALFHPNSHPILKSIDPKNVAQFLKDRKRYEDEVYEKEERNSDSVGSIIQFSIEGDLLECLHFLGHFDTLAPDVDVNDLTSDDIRKYVEGIIERFKYERGDTCCD